LTGRSVKNMPRTPEQYEKIRNEKKQRIKNVALELFASEGYHATSISQIAEKANISKGLLYNYFTSKEELLHDIIQTFSDEITEMMNPDHDEQITQAEASLFIDKYFEMMTTRADYIKLYYQLTMQPNVTELIIQMVSPESLAKTNQMFIEFLARNGNPHPVDAYMALISITKGFGVQYVFAPELFSSEMVSNFKEYLKNLFIYNEI
jgi:AcrR family transcriptional regulator